MSDQPTELLAILAFGFAIEKAGKDIFAGGFHPQNMAELLPVYTSALPAIEGMSTALPELESLDAEQGADLTAYAVAQGVLPENVSASVNKWLGIAIQAYNLFKTIKA